MRSLHYLAVACFGISVLHAAPITTPAAVDPGKTPEGLTKSDWQSIRAAHTAWEHSFMPLQDGGFQARNKGQQWTTTFDQRGFIAKPKDATWQWGLELRSYGFGARQQVVKGQPVMKADGQRLSYQWDADVQEWWVNDQRGLEHGFTVARRPAGGSASGELDVVLGTRGTLRPSVAADAQTVHFRDAAGAPVVNYAGLKVWDADGRILPSRFVAGTGGSLILRVQESAARYPITIDPMAQQAYVKSSDGKGYGDNFGVAVAVSGDTVVVGANAEDSTTIGINSIPNDESSDSGAAYVFVRSGTTWSQQAYLKPSNTDSGDAFGRAVAVSGDTVVVGAIGEDSSTTGVNTTPNNSFTAAGAAYVFVRSGTAWSQQAYLKASNSGANDNFGISVAVTGDTVVVGAHLEDSSATGVNSVSDELGYNSGAAYVFVRSGTLWSQQAYLKASNTGAGDTTDPLLAIYGDLFGSSVAVDGDTIVVGATGEDSSTTGVNSTPDDALGINGNTGAAYVFVRSGTVWSQEAYLKASNTGSGDLFGGSVAVSGDTVAVGAVAEDSSTTGVNTISNNSAGNAGAAYVFVRSGTVWSQQAYLKASNTGANDQFGTSVAVSGDTVAVGAAGEDSSTTGVNSTSDNSAVDSGAAYVFVRSGTLWSQQAYLKASNTGSTDGFGRSVAVSGDTVVVGASGEDSGTVGINSTPDELVTDAGAGYVYFRSGAAWTQQAYAKAHDTVGAGDQFGNAVAISGDTVVVGAYVEDSSTTGVNSIPNDSSPSAGAAYVFVRSGAVWSQQAYLKASEVNSADGFGFSVAVSGDTVVVGSTGEDSSTTGVNSTANNSASASGAAYVFVRSGTVWSQQAYLKPSNTDLGDAFGRAVAVSGDTVVVGAIGEDSSTTGVNTTPNNSFTAAGAAYVFVRSGTAWSQQAYLKASNSGANDNFGISVAVTGDTVVVGAHLEDSSTTGVNSVSNNSAADSGAAYVFARSGSTWTQQAYLKASNTDGRDAFGCSVGVSGDTIVVGANGEDSSTRGVNTISNNLAPSSGAAYVFKYNGTVWSQQAYLKARNTGSNDQFGYAVAISGDVVVVGAVGEDSGTSGINTLSNEAAVDSGAAYVFVRWPANQQWTQQAYLKASNPTRGDQFGFAVAVDAGTVVIGAPFEDSGTTGIDSVPDELLGTAGAAYILATFEPLGPVPTVTAVNPGFGGTTGGTPVTITGTGFSFGVTGINFGTSPVTSFAVVNDTTLNVVTGPSLAGTVSVEVATVGGTNDPNSLFIYVLPSGVIPAYLGNSSMAPAAGTGTGELNAPDATASATPVGRWDSIREGAVLASNGTLAFRGHMELGSGTPPVTVNDFQGIWKYDGTDTRLKARSGSVAPETGGAIYDMLPLNPVLNANGVMTFYGLLRIGSGTGNSLPPVTNATNFGLWSEIGGAVTPRLLLREGDVINGMSFVRGFAVATSNQNTAAVNGKFNSGTAIVHFDVNTPVVQVTVIAQEGQAAPGGGTWAPLDGNSSDPRMNNDGDIGFVGWSVVGANWVQGIYSRPSDTAIGSDGVEVQARAGSVAPGTTNATFSAFERPTVYNNGMAFRGFLNQNGDNAAGNRGQGVWSGFFGSLLPVVRTGWTNADLPSIPVGSTITSVWSPFSNASGSLTMRVGLSDGVTETRAIAGSTGGTMRLLAKAGDPVVDENGVVVPGVTFTNFDHPVIGDGDQIAFTASTSDGGYGLWKQAYGGNAPLRRVMRVGQSINTTIGDGKVVAEIVLPGATSEDRKFEQRSMDATGRVLLRVAFADGTTSLIFGQ